MCRNFGCDCHWYSCQEKRKHKRLVKKAAQLEWDDLQMIASMKGHNILLKEDAAAAAAEDADDNDSIDTKTPDADVNMEPGSEVGEAMPATTEAVAASTSSGVSSASPSASN